MRLSGYSASSRLIVGGAREQSLIEMSIKQSKRRGPA